MPTILIMDRDVSRSEHLVDLSRRISTDLHIEVFYQPEAAISWLHWHNADLVIADSQFPHLCADLLIQRLRQLPRGDHLPVLMLAPWGERELRRQVLDAGATDLLATPVDDLEFHARCGNLLTQRRQQTIIHERARWLEQRVAEATSEVRLREHETLLRLAKAGEYRDEETGNHVIRMAKYSRLIAEQLGLPPEECDAIELAAPMHDIGKIGIPDEILRKPARLSHFEFEVMKTHTVIGYEILKDSPSKYLQMGAVIALSHHEKYNGTGYPHRLGTEDIPLPARIVSVADAYDALTSERPYKPRWTMQKTIEYLNEQRGKFFDPNCLDAFFAELDRVNRIQHMLGDRQEVAVR
jgi:two-component system response regulator RpfG